LHRPRNRRSPTRCRVQRRTVGPTGVVCFA
jgi:hypothetical protein